MAGGVFTNCGAAIAWIEGMVPVDTPPVTVIQSFLDESLIVDADGRAPRDPGYTPTFSGWYAAALALEYRADMMAQQAGSVVSFSSEGSSVQRDPGASPDSLRALAARWRARALGTASTGVTVLDLGSSTGPIPRSAYWGVTPDVVDRW